MSEVLTVPFPPTPEMVEVAEDAYMPFGDMEMAIRMALLAAPAVQAEPVGEVRLEFGAQPYIFAELYSKSLPVLAPGTKLYTAPQPAEQQQPADGSLTPVPDELFAAEFNAWWEQHGQFCRAGGGDYERTFAFEAWRHLYPKLMKLQKVAAEQQPAPDVAQLVEALEAVVFYHEEVEDNDGNLMMHYSKMMRKVREALAAHRKRR